jgi:hypothetical protein
VALSGCTTFDIDIDIYIINCSWVDIRWQWNSTHLHTNNTQNTENGTYITIKKLNIHKNQKIKHNNQKINIKIKTIKFFSHDLINGKVFGGEGGDY